MSTNETQSNFTQIHDRQLQLISDLNNDEDITDNVQRIEKTAKIVKEANELFAEMKMDDKSKNLGKIYYDSKVLQAAGAKMYECAKKLNANVNTYNKQEFIQHIRSNPSFWEFMFPLEVPAVTYLYGTFDRTSPEKKPKVNRPRAKKLQDTTSTAPTILDRLQSNDAGSKLVNVMHKKIKAAYEKGGGAPLSYFHLVLHPHSFSTTIENIYNIAFLVKDGHIDIDLHETYELPCVRPLSKSEQTARQRNDEKQFIVSMDMLRWKELVEAFNIK